MNERAGEESYELGTQEAPAAPAPLRAVLREGDCFIGVSAYVAQLKEFIGAQAMQRHPVLLIADPGLRPEQVARALHEAGPQRALPFYSVNARSLSGEALHRLLFGPHGVIETCQRGTVYLNDLASLPVMVQQRFAACIEEHRWRHSSGDPLQQRLVFATEWNPGAETKISAENRLAYGLVEVLRQSSFRLKPLRERSEDIPYLAAHLAERLAQRLRRGAVELTPGALKALTDYEWGGNVDELEAVLESAIGQTPSPRDRREPAPAAHPLRPPSGHPARRHRPAASGRRLRVEDHHDRPRAGRRAAETAPRASSASASRPST